MKIAATILMAISVLMVLGGVLHFVDAVNLKDDWIAVAWVVVGISNGVYSVGRMYG